MIILTSIVQSQLVSLSRAALPNEACGYLVLSEDRIVLLPNTAEYPQYDFRMTLRPADIERVRQHGLRGVALWHSHPRTLAALSSADRRLMAATPFAMIIVSLKAAVPIIRVYARDGRIPVEVASYRVEDAATLQTSPNMIHTHTHVRESGEPLV